MSFDCIIRFAGDTTVVGLNPSQEQDDSIQSVGGAASGLVSAQQSIS